MWWPDLGGFLQEVKQLLGGRQAERRNETTCMGRRKNPTQNKTQKGTIKCVRIPTYGD